MLKLAEEFRFARPKLLIVDDREENLLALSTVLKEQDYDVVEVLSGLEAIDAANNDDFVAILMDVQMPGMDGFEAARRIRLNSRSKRTPIIFVTAIHRTEAYEHKGYVAGAVDYLFKPINVEILKAKLSVFAELHRKTLEIKYQAEQLKIQELREKEFEWLREALRTRDEFISMASHELKTPITPLNLQMQTFLKMLDDGSFEKVSPDRLKRMLSLSYSQVERLSRTIDELLDVSRFSTGRVQMSFKDMDLVESVKKVLASFSAQLKSVGCEYHLESPSEIRGCWDPFRIEQVFINILVNAMKYGAGEPIHVRLVDSGDHVELRVKDHGIGIAREDQERIFKRFERAVSPKNFGGLGLGLYIAGEVIRHHHGTIFVESEPGHGAEFIVSLPRNTAFRAVRDL